ncbi:MAG: putative DNA binding domain-containing protein [Chitinophagaceae bacterium]|nr:putative DNA binding domain-containing protein [Anaerolineae bacterium]
MIPNLELIKTGQSSRVAFLEKADPKVMAETMVAFANTDGGMIIIGLKEDGEPSKIILESDKLEKALKDADNLCNPTVVVGNWEETESADGSKVYSLRIPRSIELHTVSDGRVLIRSGIKNRPLGGQEILRLASAKGTGDFESEIMPTTSKEDFSRKMIDEYLEKRAERTKRPYNGKLDDLLREIGAVDNDLKPTVTGILLFSEYPQQWLPQCSVVFVKFVGKTPRGESGLAGYTRREELTGPLPRLIESAWNLIWSEMAVSAVVKGLEREETYEYPPFAVREAIVNAVCHRDYRLKGRRVEIRMYSDRLEVISPGGLPGFITVENIKDEHFSRNPRIVNGLFQWGYIEELGLGIDRMIEVMHQAGHKPPSFDARPYSFAVTLHNAREKQSPPEWTRNTNHRQARALQYIRDNGSITNREYRLLCEGISAETLRLDLADMVEKGILVKVGSKKGTYYILK